MTKRIRGGIKEKNYKIKYIFMREKEKEVYVKERWKSQMKKISKVLLLVIVSVAFCFGITGQQVEARDTSIIYGDGTITRAEWLHDLTVMFDMTVEKDNMPDDYFSDVTSAHVYYKDIMMAAEFGVIDIEAGQKVKPDEAATREFAAHTLNYCLGYKLEDKTYTYKDTTGIKYPDDTQIAINRGWFALESGRFNPEKTITKSEIENMVSDAKTVQQSTQIDENYKNNYEFTSNVIEIPQDVSVYVDKDKNVTIVNCPKKITVGDTFAVYENGVAQVYTAKGITVDGSDTVIVTNDVDIDKVTESVDAQGTEEGDLKQAEAVGDAQITYIEGGTEEQAYENGRAYRSRRRISGNKKISAVKASKKLELGAGKSFTINCTLSNVSVDYKINSGKREAYVKANGTAIITGKGEWDAVAAAGKSGSIELVKIPVAYVGVITVTAEYSMNGEVTLTYTTGFQTGLQYSPQDGFRLTKDFQKKSFTLHSKTKLSAGVTASIGLVKLPVISGKIYAKMGAQTVIESETFDDGKSPKMCTTVSSWLYASAGANASLDFYVTKKSFSKTYDIFNENNSPVRLVYHFEDGHLIYPCSRGLASAKGYFTKWNSRYGSSWGGYGLDENGTPKPVFTYSLDDDGNATITGYTGNVSALVIPDEIDGHKVVKLGNGVFKKHQEIVSAQIPDSITSISASAFRDCSNLENVNLPKNLISIGNRAFFNCVSIRNIYIPKTLVEVDTYGWNWWYPFEGCSNLEKVEFEEGITQIPTGIFGDTGLKEAEIPDTVTSIGERSFADCANLEKVILSKNLKSIGNRAFVRCTKIEKINLPRNLTEVDTYGWNWWYPFAGCSNLEKVEFEEGITQIPTGIFGDTGLKEVEIPDTVTSIGERSFADCANLEKVTFSKNLKSIGNRAFVRCTKIEKINLPKSLTEVDTYGWNWWYPFDGCSNLKTIEFEEGITQIPTGIFGNTGLENVKIPDTVTSIGERSFADCTKLEKIIFSEKIETINGRAFLGCSSLKSVSLPDSITSMDTEIFSGCTSLSSVKLPNKCVNITSSTFEGCTSLTEITLPDTVTTIQDHAFKNCTALKTINWSKSITDIQSYAFENCDALTKLDIPNTVTNIGTGAFYECGGFTDIAVPNSVKSLGSKVFENCDALTDVKLGTGITQIPTSCFEHCDALPSVVLPYRVSKVGDNAFKNCVELTEITIPRATTSISTSAFSYPAKMTVYGISGTYAETFANQQGMKFVDKAVRATNVVLDKTELTLNKGMKYSLTMTVTPATFTDEVSWKSTNVDVAAIAEDGTVTAKGAGQATIKVTVGEVSATCKVNVVQPVTSIYLNKTSLEMTALDTYQLQASVYPSEANNKEVSWESSDEKVATVDENGLVQAKEKGTAVITAKAKDGSEVSRSCKVTVKNTAYVVTDISKLESTHNYENNCSDFWVYTKTGASALNITFNSKTALEEDFDYLYVFDKENKQVGKYTGTQLAGKTITVSGDTVKIQLVSDDAGNAWGFKVDVITEKVEEECKHTDTTKREVRNAKAATCTLDGYSGDIYCTNCGNLIEAGSVTKAVGHQWDNGVITKAATATQTGIKTYTCTVCKITRTEVIKALGNNTKPIGNSNKPKLKTGEKITDKSTGAVYKVTGKNTVEYVKATSKKASRTIPSTVKLKGIKCQVTSIATKAFKGDPKIKAVVIPATVRKIGKEAFAKCKNLKKITIKTTYLSSKKVGANAFKGIHAKATIKVPKKQKKAYQKLLKARGVGKKVTVK